MSNFNLVRPETPDVDDVLRKFFRREMPASWPACPTPAPAPNRRLVSLWAYRMPRLALAASVALLFAGYLTVARWFPQDTVSDGLSPVAPNIGLKNRPERVTTPRGTEAEIIEEPTDGGQGLSITIQAVPPAKSRR